MRKQLWDYSWYLLKAGRDEIAQGAIRLPAEGSLS